jgi:hypothetical protein
LAGCTSDANVSQPLQSELQNKKGWTTQKHERHFKLTVYAASNYDGEVKANVVQDSESNPDVLRPDIKQAQRKRRFCGLGAAINKNPRLTLLFKLATFDDASIPGKCLT